MKQQLWENILNNGRKLVKEEVKRYSLEFLSGAYEFEDLRGKVFFLKDNKFFKRDTRISDKFIEIRKIDLMVEFKFDKDIKDKISYLTKNNDLVKIIKPIKKIK